MQINNNSPSFGMAWKVNERSLEKAMPSEIKKLALLLKEAGPERLNKASQFVDCRISACVENGIIKNLFFVSFPDGKGLRTLAKAISAKLMGKLDSINYVKKIKIEDINAEKLVKTVEEVSTNALDQFGSVDRDKSILNDIKYTKLKLN
mgnify:CR=1 FL=1